MDTEGRTREQVLNEETIGVAVGEIADAIAACHPEDVPLGIVGIHNRGVTLADRVIERLKEKRANFSRGVLDISLYRDDLDNLDTIPSIRASEIPFNIEGAVIVLFDDVLFTGRTVRAAIDGLVDYGRPRKIELAVLVDRGNREFPIAADYVGRQIDTSADDYVTVRFKETDEEEGVFVFRK